MPKYKTVSINIEMYEAFNNYILAHPELGYASLVEYVREALRQSEWSHEALAEYKQLK